MVMTRFARFAWTLPLSAAAILGTALALSACGGGGMARSLEIMARRSAVYASVSSSRVSKPVNAGSP